MTPSTIVVRAAPGRKSRAIVRFGAITVPAAIGRSGRTVFVAESGSKIARVKRLEIIIPIALAAG